MQLSMQIFLLCSLNR